MKMSLIINTYNRIFMLPNTLRSLEYLRYPDLEVIVVDGPSTDGTLEYLEANWKSKIKICVCPEANLSRSRNIGIANSSGDVVCFTDDDGIPEPDWLDELARAYENPGVAAAGGWSRDETGVQYWNRYMAYSRNAKADMGGDDAALYPPSQPHAFRIPGLIGVNCSFRRTALLEVGGFDEEYAYHLDETDVLVRLVDAGHAIRMIPGAQVHHKVAPGDSRTANRMAKSWMKTMISKAYFIVRNALPESSLSELMTMIEGQKDELRICTHWFLSEKMTNEQRFNELMAEIERAADIGIADAFSPCRKLIRPFEPAPWLPFPRRLTAKARIRVAFVAGNHDGPILDCARSIASAGHEATLITQAEHGRPHTVDFEEGVWVHRLPPDGFNVLAELDRVNERRGFQKVVGTKAVLDGVMASGKYEACSLDDFERMLKQ